MNNMNPISLYEHCKYIQRVLITAPRRSGKTHFLTYYYERKKNEYKNLNVGFFFLTSKHVKEFKRNYDLLVEDNTFTIDVFSKHINFTDYDVIFIDEILFASRDAVSNIALLRKPVTIVSISTPMYNDCDIMKNMDLLTESGFTIILHPYDL